MSELMDGEKRKRRRDAGGESKEYQGTKKRRKTGTLMEVDGDEKGEVQSRETGCPLSPRTEPP